MQIDRNSKCAALRRLVLELNSTPTSNALLAYTRRALGLTEAMVSSTSLPAPTKRENFRPTMLSTLPQDTLLSVLHDSSQLPASVNWSAHVDEKDLENLFALDPRFRTVAAYQVGILALSPNPHALNSHLKDDYERFRVGEVLENENVVTLLHSNLYDMTQPDLALRAPVHGIVRVTDFHQAFRLISENKYICSTLVVADPCGEQAYDEDILESLAEAAVNVRRLILNTSCATQWL